jgi:excisionase family DNA binding protein
VTIGQAATLTGLHKNTIRAYIKQGRLAAAVVRGKYGQEYRIDRAELVALAALVSPLIQERSDRSVVTAQEGPSAPTAEAAVDESSLSQGLAGESGAEDASGILESASPHTLSLEPLVGLLRQVQEENRNLAGQLGFVQAQLQQARETIRLLQAPPQVVGDREEGVIEAGVNGMAEAEEVGRLKAELEQAQQRIAEFEAVTDELEREQEAAAAEGARRPWWRFWG